MLKYEFIEFFIDKNGILLKYGETNKLCKIIKLNRINYIFVRIKFVIFQIISQDNLIS